MKVALKEDKIQIKFINPSTESNTLRLLYYNIIQNVERIKTYLQ